jgi:hypothetical protein
MNILEDWHFFILGVLDCLVVVGAFVSPVSGGIGLVAGAGVRVGLGAL